MQEKSIKILLTNDDGYFSNGINKLESLLVAYGDVISVAPKDAQSAKSTALTMDLPLRLTFLSEEKFANGHIVKRYHLNGTPTDCVKAAIVKLFKDPVELPDIVVSGINHGSNAASAEMYSGTLGATKEGALYGIPSIGFSIDIFDHNADLSSFDPFFDGIFRNFLDHPPVKGTFLNVNWPMVPADEIKGVKLSVRGNGRWTKEFNIYKDPHGAECLWMAGYFISEDDRREIADHLLLEAGYITVTPHKVDNTDLDELERMKRSWRL